MRKRRKLTVESNTSTNNKNNNFGESGDPCEDIDKLKRVHDEFEEFLNVVVDDLSEKVSKLRVYRSQDISNSVKGVIEIVVHPRPKSCISWLHFSSLLLRVDKDKS